MASLVGRPRVGGGRFRRPWLGGRLFYVRCFYVGVRYCTVAARVRSLVCTSCEAWKARYVLFEFKARYAFQFKNLTAIFLHAARWI